MSTCEPVCIDDFEQHAKKILPMRNWNYYSGGANALVTLQDSNNAFKRLRLRPRVLRDVSNVDTSTTILGEKIEFPVCVSPTAVHKLAHPDGEVATARASYSAGTCMVLSSFNTSTIEEVARSSAQGIKWYHLHLLPDDKDNVCRIHRAENEGYKAIVFTVDDPYKGKDYSFVRHQLIFPLHLASKEAPIKYLKAALKSGIAYRESHGRTWDVIQWIRSISKLPIVLKGILTAEDAKLAVQHGVDGIIVSNHGGRQLDTVPTTIEVLPEIVAAVDNQCEVYLDGGIRFGTDVFKALALGARAVFVGRPVLWGLAYQGEKGVYKVLQILKEEFRLAMGLAGCASLKDISRDMVIHQSYYSRI